LERVLEPHRIETVKRAREVKRVLVAHDTTEFRFSSDRKGLGAVGGMRGGAQGFSAHCALAISGDEKREVLGVLAVKPMIRARIKAKRDSKERKKDENRESLRWSQNVEATSRRLGDVDAIHLMDREGDIYELLAGMVKAGRRFVVRSAQNRLLEDGSKLLSSLGDAPVMVKREVTLSTRKRPTTPSSRKQFPARAGRPATLHVAAKSIEIRKAKSACDQMLPPTLTLNVVHVFEPSPPPGQDPVEWRLLTTEPIETADQLAAIVDAYRARWVIEEYFKALKTGCAYESRQLESATTLLNMLGILAVVAWRLLVLRTLSRDSNDHPATDALSPIQVEVLRAVSSKKTFSPIPTVREAMLAIAALGGHIPNNGPPGWLVLTRGFIDLSAAVRGYSAAKSITNYDQS
jgi:IS4 transposase